MNNKYQNALNSLNPNYIGEQEYSWRKATEILQELVDKETPTKVTEIYTDSYYCPNCGNEVLRFKYHTEYTHKYCLNCGQHLDWGEE